MDRIKLLRTRLDKVQRVMANHPHVGYSKKALRLAIKICKEIRLEETYQQAIDDDHSCTANSQYTYFGPAGPGDYCTECGALVQSSDSERHAFDHEEN